MKLFTKIVVIIVIVTVADSARKKPEKCNEKKFDVAGCVPEVCPKDQPLYNCLVDPCEGKTCPGTPDAQCVANYCGGCNTEFYTCGCVPACCGGHNQPCDTGLPHASEDDCACQGDLVCCANEDDFRTGTCLTQEEADKKGDICNPTIRG
ncbi:uncharacterized protein LOC144864527 [Branchiostoma floridae x Branchiostoma japonicum]